MAGAQRDSRVVLQLPGDQEFGASHGSEEAAAEAEQVQAISG